jgi:hypothetical protein
VKLADLPADAPPHRVTFVPFSNIGRWYREGIAKPDRNSDAFSYAVWLYDEKSRPFIAYAAERAKVREFGKGAIDYVIPGDFSEAAHGLAVDRSNTGPFNGRVFRDGQSFSYVMKVPTDAPARLVVTYWGGEAAERRFSVLINGDRIASQRLLNNKPGQFFDESYDIPVDLVAGKTDADGKLIDKVTVQFVAAPNSIAGGVFGIRILKK